MFDTVVRKGVHLCVACASAFGLQAQTVTLLDQVTRTPIPDVTLTCVQTGAVVASNSDGRADISPLKGCGSIRFDHLSYTALTLDWATLSTSKEVDLSYRVNMLREVVTSGSRFTEAKQDVPEQIDVLGRGGELRKIVAFRKFAFICLVKRSQMWTPNTPLQRGCGCLKGGNSAAERPPRLHFQVALAVATPQYLPWGRFPSSCKTASQLRLASGLPANRT